MGILEVVTTGIPAAMKAREQVRLATLRMLKAALVTREIEKGRALDEPEALQVVASLIKQRRDSIDQFAKGGRQDLVDKEQAELRILETFLPPAIDAAALERIVEEAVAEVGATSVKDLGRVMKAVMPRLAGQAVDGRLVNEAVRRKLGG